MCPGVRVSSSRHGAIGVMTDPTADEACTRPRPPAPADTAMAAPIAAQRERAMFIEFKPLRDGTNGRCTRRCMRFWLSSPATCRPRSGDLGEFVTSISARTRRTGTTTSTTTTSTRQSVAKAFADEKHQRRALSFGPTCDAIVNNSKFAVPGTRYFFMTESSAIAKNWRRHGRSFRRSIKGCGRRVAGSLIWPCSTVSPPLPMSFVNCKRASPTRPRCRIRRCYEPCRAGTENSNRLSPLTTRMLHAPMILPSPAN